MLDSTYDINENMFRRDQHYCIISINNKELIAKHQQGRVLTAIGGDINKIITGLGANELELG